MSNETLSSATMPPKRMGRSRTARIGARGAAAASAGARSGASPLCRRDLTAAHSAVAAASLVPHVTRSSLSFFLLLHRPAPRAGFAPQQKIDLVNHLDE